MPWNERTKRRLKLRDLDILMAIIATGSMGKAADRLTVLPGFMLKVPGRHPRLKAVPVKLPNPRMPIGLITLKDRMLTPLAQLFIERVRAVTKPMATQRP